MNLRKRNLQILKKNFIYDESMEHDSCGVGLVASTEGIKSRKVVEQGIEALKAVWHRGAIDADGNCIEFIDENEMGKTHFGGNEDRISPSALTIRTIDGNDYLIVTGKEQWCTRYNNKGKCKNRSKRFKARLVFC